MYNLIEDFFQLIIRIFLNLSPITINKGLRVSQGLIEKCFELVSSDWGQNISFQLFFVLLLMEINSILKKKGCKRDSIRFNSSSNGKMIFIPLTKVIIPYMGLTTIDVGLLGLENLISSSFLQYLSLKDCLNNLLQVLLGILSNISKSFRR